MAIDNYPKPRLPISNAMWRYNAVGGETTLSGYDSFGQPLQYTVNSEQLFLNGVMLVRGADYAATTGTSITGLTALSAGDFVEILTYSNFNVATLPAANITGSIVNSQLNKSSITLGSTAINLGDTISSVSGLTIDGNSNTIRTARGTTNPSSGTVAGDLFWNTTSSTLQVYNGSTWISFAPPGTPTIGSATDIGTSRLYNNAAASVSFTPNAVGGVANQYLVTSTPGSLTSYGTSSPITITNLTSSTQYTFTVTAIGSFGNSIPSTSTGPVTVTSVPQAPTIGTATTTGITTATVAFTANATGGSAITSYTVTSSPGGVTASGASSPITVAGLTGGTPYTFTVTATNANGTSVASSGSNQITTNSYPVVTGGTLASDSTYYYRVFTGNGTLAVTSATITADVLQIAGGGGGGYGWGGGGGAGGVIHYAGTALTAANYSVAVGAGGVTVNGNTTSKWPGSNSTFTGLNNALGGGGGAGQGAVTGGNGGSGGGASTNGGTANSGADGGSATQTSGTGYTGYGNVGGGTTNNASGKGGAGGGGAGAPGTFATGAGSGTNAFSSWLSAITSAMTGVSGWATATSTGYIAGGGGAHSTSPVTTGGAGGGGNYGVNGTANTGGGGGSDFGSGASGLVVVRYTKASVGG
jgi:hypothetical protein